MNYYKRKRRFILNMLRYYKLYNDDSKCVIKLPKKFNTYKVVYTKDGYIKYFIKENEDESSN